MNANKIFFKYIERKFIKLKGANNHWVIPIEHTEEDFFRAINSYGYTYGYYISDYFKSWEIIDQQTVEGSENDIIQGIKDGTIKPRLQKSIVNTLAQMQFKFGRGLPIETTVQEEAKCTCGAKFADGLHTSWCDLNRKD